MSLPSGLYDQGVQLCVPSNKIAANVSTAVEMLDQGNRHVFDIKYDGIRSLAFVSDGAPRLVNRRGVNITYRYPEVVTALAIAYAGHDIVLDGEIVVFDQHGNADFAKSHLRDAQSNAQSAEALAKQYPATFMAFDILHFHNDDVRRLPYKGRHALLSTQALTAFKDAGAALAWSKPRVDGCDFWLEVQKLGLEGLVAKDVRAPYRAGRNPAWIKLKQAFQISAVAVGMTPGKGARQSTFGALEMRLIAPDGTLIDIGEVGTGFKERDLISIKERMEAGELLVLEVEIAAITKDLKCRFPSFKGIRTDKTAPECTTDQLEGVPIIG